MSMLPPNSPLSDAFEPLRLSDLRNGERARVERTELCCEDCELLNAMGLTDHCELRVCRHGEPCIVEVNSTRLGLSSVLADRIFVRPLGRYSGDGGGGRGG